MGLSHEINSPLEVIINELALIERGSGKLEERLDAIRDEIVRIGRQLATLNEMAEQEDYASTSYLGEKRMVNLAGRPNPLDGARVLVVDDDAGVRRSVAEILTSDGCRVREAENGVRALALLEGEPFDLLLSDVVMPDMDGYELYQQAQQRFPELPVALMTGFYYDREHVIKRSRMQGLEGVLFKKPINPEMLRETLGGLLRPPSPAPS